MTVPWSFLVFHDLDTFICAVCFINRFSLFLFCGYSKALWCDRSLSLFKSDLVLLVPTEEVYGTVTSHHGDADLATWSRCCLISVLLILPPG